MNEVELLERLKANFVADLLGAILPGAIHNFANPLNGLTGRIKLLEMHLSRVMPQIKSIDAQSIRDESLDKVSRDIGILTEESERLLDLFRNFETKIIALSSSEQQTINLADLVASEVQFMDCYLDFKHGVTKEMQVDRNIPTISGSRAGYSLSILSLINFARLRMQDVSEKKLAVWVGCDDADIKIVFRDTGEPIPPPCRMLASGESSNCDAVAPTDAVCCWSLLLLKLYGLRIHIDFIDGWNVVSLARSYRAA